MNIRRKLCTSAILMPYHNLVKMDHASVLIHTRVMTARLAKRASKQLKRTRMEMLNA
jgi:hypothetical protein